MVKKNEPETRRTNGQLTPRGERTKAALLEAARTVFERDGFLNARITDIAEEADVAHGTFYTYFTDKEAVFGEVVASLQREFLGEQERPPRPPDETPYEAILRANRHYYDAYRGRGAMMGIVEQVATFNPELRVMRREIRKRFVDRNERAIRRWQEQGMADPRLDPHYAASALGSMVDRSIYIWLVLEEPHDPDVAIETLSRLWANALGLPTPDGDAPAPRRKRRQPATKASPARRPVRRTTS
jgi:AcrR family transcriptional regulator